MAQVSEKMQKGIKDTMAVVIAEMSGSNVKDVRAWLDSVKTADDFFGTNKQGLAEYNNFIKQREIEYNNAVRNKAKRI